MTMRVIPKIKTGKIPENDEEQNFKNWQETTFYDSEIKLNKKVPGRGVAENREESKSSKYRNWKKNTRI